MLDKMTETASEDVGVCTHCFRYKLCKSFQGKKGHEMHEKKTVYLDICVF